MDTIDKSKEKQGHEVDDLIKKPVWENLPDLDERVRKVLREGIAEPQPEIAKEAVMPRIKGLEILKEGVYAIDLEKTINDMFMVMKSMETQLERVLTINSHLEKDRNEAKEMIVELKESKSQLEDKIARMEAELPSKRELQMEIEQLIEERNNMQPRIREQESRVKKMQETMIQHQSQIGNLEEEKRDAIAEIDFLESRLNADAEKIRLNNSEINELKGEKLAHVEKIKTLEEGLNAALDDKYRLINELKMSQKAVAELHSAISDKKRQAKRSFYEGTGKGKKDT